MPQQRLLRATPFVWAVLVVFVLLLASFVVSALRRPPVIEAAITPPRPILVGDSLVGPDTVTLDATDPERWTFFDFSRNAAVAAPGPLDWDVAVRRFHLIANGGPGFAGQGGLADLGTVPFDSLAEAPESGYTATTSDSANSAIRRWYAYGWTSHLLTSKAHVYALRTADGKYAKLAIVGYYCSQARPGCLTVRYAYQGDGSRLLRGAARTPSTGPAAPAR